MPRRSLHWCWCSGFVFTWGGTFASEGRALLALPGRTGARCALTRTFLPCWPASMSSLTSNHGMNPPFAMLGAGLSCCKASCHAAGYEAEVLLFRTISEKCGVRSEDCLDGPRSFSPCFVSLNWGLGRPGQAPGVAGAASKPARATDDVALKIVFRCQKSWNGGLATSPAPKEASPHLFEHTRACPGPLDTLVRPPGRRCDPWAPRTVHSRLRVRQHRALPGCGVSAKGAQWACFTACNGCGRPPKAY